jgi:uncharacterized protein
MNRHIIFFFAAFNIAGNCFDLYAQNKLYPNKFSLVGIVMLEGPFKHASDLKIEVLLKYDADRLFAPFRKVTGLPEKAKCFSK